MSEIKKYICFYHRVDADGWCSGAQVHKHLTNKGHDVIMWAINYGDRTFPWDEIDEHTEVWMVDFGLQPFEQMIKLKEKAGRLLWIDHHKTVIDDMADFGESFHGLQAVYKAGADEVAENKISASELVWQYLNMTPPIEPVRLVGRYDIWDWRNNPGALELSVGLRRMKEGRDPTSRLWGRLLSESHRIHLLAMNEVIKEGQTALHYRDEDWIPAAHSLTFETEFDGHKVGAANRTAVNSMFFDPLEDRFPDVDFFIAFAWRRNQWFINCYKPDWLKNDVHCGDICHRYGGGGHEGAAGFQRSGKEGLPFELK